MNLDFAKVCGKHSAIYEAYYKQIDPKGSGAIEAMTAAKFLKKSGLSDVVLSRIWDLSDPNGKGFLDKPGFFVALKLVSLAQAGQVINMSNIYTDTTNPPKVGDMPKIMPPRIQTAAPGVSSAGVAGSDWSIKIIDRLKYEQLFESLKPVGGMLAGNKVKGVLMDSKLPMDTLGKIWDLADQDKDGNLDKHEFIVAMHLVYQTLEKRIVPDVLPPELRKAGGGPPPKPAPPVIANVGAVHAGGMPRAPSGEGFGDGGFVANFPKDIAPPPAIPPLPAAVPPMPRVPIVPPQPLISTDPLIPIGTSAASAGDWVVTPAELKRYEIIFRDSDRDKDGLVSGLEVKNVFLQSGVPQNCLAHIWALCDTNQSGKLTLEQFALAMWMVERKQKGLEPPQVLNSNMVPPSMRGIVTGVDLQSQEPKPTYSNPELEMISKEIEELAKERRALETEIAQKEADIRIKSGEVRSLQSELDTLSATLKQLEHQRGEAQKRLDDLKVQVTKIREQCQKQEETINEQEGELNSKRSELQKLKDEEAALQKEYEENNKELQNLTKHLQNTQLQISSVRSMVTQLLETQRQMTDALLMCRAAIESNEAELVTEYQLKIEPDFDDARKILDKKIEITKADPFNDGDNNTIKATNGFTTNGFGSDPFGAASITNTVSRTGTGFDDSFNSGFDSFGGGNAAFGAQQNKDPFGSDTFAASKSNAITPEPGKDDFGSDPFAALHAPTGQGQVLSPNTQKSGPPPRPESPSPALPPKKSKVPPPRPAPPRPLQGPTRPTQPSADSFGPTANSSGGFADFADFDNKQTSINPPPSLPLPTTTTTTKSSMQFQSLAPTLALNSINKSSLLFHTSASSSTFTSNSLSLSATTAATTITTTTTPTLNSTTNNLNRLNNTSLQPSTMFAANIKSNLKSVAATSTELVPPTPPPTVAAPIIYGPTDFSDDPFKDYRYEDPFSIKDPFADDDDNSNSEENIFKDDLSSNDDDNNNADADEKQKEDNLKQLTKVNTPMISDSTRNTAQTFGSAKSNSNTPLSNEFLEQFDSFNINSSPVPTSTQSNRGFGGAGETTTTKAATAASTSTSVNSQRNTPVSGLGSNVFDNFADFDAFSTKSTKSSTNSLIELSRANINNNKAPSLSSTELNNDSTDTDTFFDAFNDNFLNNTKVHTTKKSTNSQNIFDAFGSEDTSSDKSRAAVDAFGSVPNIVDASPAFNDRFVIKSAKVFDDDFSDANAFEDDFFKDKSSVSPPADVNLNFNKPGMEKTKITRTKTITDNFATFDAFHDDANNFSTALNNSINLEGAAFIAGGEKLSKVKNNTMPHHKMHSNEAGAKLASKYSADYSNSDSFHNDLEEVLKRSMLEK